MQEWIRLEVMVAGLFAAILGTLEIGRRIGVRRKHDGEISGAGLGVVDGAVFGLMGLITAFTFSGAGARFDARRQLIGQEANAIGTAYMRLDLLPPEAQRELREDFRSYVDARIGIYRNIAVEPDAARAEQARSAALQQKLWSEAVAGCREAGSVATTSLVLSSINEMIDMTTTRTVAHMTHPPAIIYWGLIVLVLACALLAGYDMSESKKPSWIHMVVFSAVMATAIYVILDIEYPRLGLIRVEAADQLLIDVRNSMG